MEVLGKTSKPIKWHCSYGHLVSFPAVQALVYTQIIWWGEREREREVEIEGKAETIKIGTTSTKSQQQALLYVMVVWWIRKPR